MPISPQQSQTLKHLTTQKLQKMFDDKKQTPKLLIPKQLPSFIKSTTFISFLESVYEYCLNFNEIIKQYTSLKQKMQNRVGDDTFLLRKQKQELALLEKQVSYHYAAILVKFNMQCMEEDRKRSNFKDQVFFQALIYLVERVVKELFNREDFLVVQEEINRLFRTNRYNLIKKRHENDQLLQKFPALKQQTGKNKSNLAHILNRAPQRISAFKRSQKQKRHNSMYQDYTTTLGIPKQLSNADMQQRSPLLCTWLPSRKSMLGDFSQISAYSNQIQANQKKTNSFHTITEGTTIHQGRSRIAAIGSNVITNYQY